ncbi:MAG: hypothetical protein GTO14_11180 [Anaerolineales bacterium]|nr:hypothetical protein [Anaerolineales bacterium]
MMKKPSRRLLAAITAVFVLISMPFLISRGLVPSAVAQRGQEEPTLIPAKVLVPVPTPEDAREIAILDLFVVSTEDGRVEGVELQRARILRSYAPNVLMLQGPWTILLLGRGEVMYGVRDPRVVHVYDGEEEVPHGREFEAQVLWELVVPLFDKGQDLGVKEIRILDQAGELIFSTPVDREAWRQKR